MEQISQCPPGGGLKALTSWTLILMFTFHDGDMHRSSPGSRHTGESRSVGDRGAASTWDHPSPGQKQKRRLIVNHYFVLTKVVSFNLSHLWISGGSLFILALCSMTSFATFPLQWQKSGSSYIYIYIWRSWLLSLQWKGCKRGHGTKCQDKEGSSRDSQVR